MSNVCAARWVARLESEVRSGRRWEDDGTTTQHQQRTREGDRYLAPTQVYRCFSLGEASARAHCASAAELNLL